MRVVQIARGHGTITSIDVTEALALPGVVAVLTGVDLELQPSPLLHPTVARPFLAMDPSGTSVSRSPQVVADTRPRPQPTPREAVIVDIEPMDAYVDVEAAMSGRHCCSTTAPANAAGKHSTAVGLPDTTGGRTSSPTARS